jgi:hypothetical protein
MERRQRLQSVQLESHGRDLTRPVPEEAGGKVRFLSPEWFDELEALANASAEDAREPGVPRAVVEQVVTGTPFGEVRYRVEVFDLSLRMVGPRGLSVQAASKAKEAPTVTVHVEWDTACAIASGERSAHQALADGQVKVRGNLSALGSVATLSSRAEGLEMIPEALRSRTSFA